jgi:hypothetical protein
MLRYYNKPASQRYRRQYRCALVRTLETRGVSPRVERIGYALSEHINVRAYYFGRMIEVTAMVFDL